MPRRGSPHRPRGPDLEALLAGVLSLMLLIQCGGVCLWPCLLGGSHHRHEQLEPSDHGEHRPPTHQTCRHPVLSASSAGPAPALLIPGPVARLYWRFVATLRPESPADPVFFPAHTAPEPDYPPPRG